MAHNTHTHTWQRKWSVESLFGIFKKWWMKLETQWFVFFILHMSRVAKKKSQMSKVGRESKLDRKGYLESMRAS